MLASGNVLVLAGRGGEFIGKEFEGDEAAQLGVFSFVNNTHAATTELLDDAVVRDGLVDHEGMSRRSGRFILRTPQRAVNGWQI